MIVSVDGAELFYSSRGVGPVCLVPSAVGTRAYERQMPPQLSEGRQLAEAEGERPAADYERRRRDGEAWARATGWRSREVD